MTVGSRRWKEFFLKDIFVVAQRGKRLTKVNQIYGSKAYVSSTASSNGIDGFIGNSEGVRAFANCLTIANSGSVGASFYHPYEFVASDHVTHLKNDSFGPLVYLFIATQTGRLSEKYNFNREINDKRISREKVMLPIGVDGEPDHAYMEQFIRSLIDKKRSEFEARANRELRALKFVKIPPLADKTWKPFKIKEIFGADKGVYLNKKDIVEGNTPYITATASNNGISGFIGNRSLFPRNTITVEKISLAPFYQGYEYYCSHDVSVLSSPSLNKFNALFISTMIKRQGGKYSYGRQAQLGVVKRETVYLPVLLDGSPDYEYMKQYAQNLYCKKIKQYLDYLNAVEVMGHPDN